MRRRKNELRAAEGIHRSAMRERERRRARRQARQRARDQWAVNAKYEAATEGGASSQSKATAAMTGQVSLSGSATPSSGASSRLVSPGGNVVVGVGDDRSPRPLTSNPGDGDRSSRESGGGQEVTAPTAAWGEMLTSEDAKPHSEGAGGADAVHSLGSAGGDGAGTPLTQDTLGGEGAAAGERSVSGTFLAEDGAVGATGSLLDARSERSSSSAEELESGGEEEEEVLVEATVPGGHTATMGREVLLPQTFWDALADEEERSPPMADPLWASGGGAFDSFDAVPEDDEDDEGDVDQEMKEEEGEGEGEGEGAKAPTREGAVGPAPDLRRLESDKVWVSKPPLQDLPRRVHHTVGAGPLDLAGAEEGGGEEGEGGKHEARLEVESGGTLPRRADQGSSGSLASRGSADSSSLDKRRSQRRGQLLAARHARSQQRSSSRRGKDVRVRSWLSLQQQGVEEGDEQVQRIRALNSEESLEDMASLEERHKALVGPQFGFDLGMIHAHYAHRAALRVRYAILRDGAATLARALHGLGEHRHVLAFVRHDPDATPTSGAHGGATVRRPTGLEAELQEAAPLAPVGSWAGVGQGDGALSQGLGVDGDDEGGLPLGEDGRGGEGAGRSPSCAALIAANFNDHPSQVLVDCAATAGAFRGGYPTSGALREALASNGTSDERARAFAHIPARAWGHGDDAAAEGTDRGGLRRLAAAECLGEMLDPGAVLAGVEVLHGSNNAGVVAGLETWPNMGDEKVAAAASFVPFIAAPWECAHGGVPLHLRPYASLCILTRTVRRSQRAPPLAVARASADCDVKGPCPRRLESGASPTPSAHAIASLPQRRSPRCALPWPPPRATTLPTTPATPFWTQCLRGRSRGFSESCRWRSQRPAWRRAGPTRRTTSSAPLSATATSWPSCGWPSWRPRSARRRRAATTRRGRRGATSTPRSPTSTSCPRTPGLRSALGAPCSARCCTSCRAGCWPRTGPTLRAACWSASSAPRCAQRSPWPAWTWTFRSTWSSAGWSRWPGARSWAACPPGPWRRQYCAETSWAAWCS